MAETKRRWNPYKVPLPERYADKSDLARDKLTIPALRWRETMGLNKPTAKMETTDRDGKPAVREVSQGNADFFRKSEEFNDETQKFIDEMNEKLGVRSAEGRGRTMADPGEDERERRWVTTATYGSGYDGADEAAAEAVLRHATGRKVERLVYDPLAEGEDPVRLRTLPKSAYQRDGRYYRMAPEVVDELALSTDAERKAYDGIQRQFYLDNGRQMDHETAVIRARLAAGTLDRSGALNVARALRRRRDVALAKAVAKDYYRELGVTPDKVDAKDAWKPFYVDTSALGRAASRRGMDYVLDIVNKSPSGRGADLKNRTLARRFGLEEITRDVVDSVRNPDADVPGNYARGSGRRAAAKRLAMRVLEGTAPGNRRTAEAYLARNDVQSVDVDDYTGLDSRIPAWIERRRKVGTGQYRVSRSALTRMQVRKGRWW